ncbi:hypothetical protein [Halothece sp. PCC 7418]|uniref:hypothetical protein n=1 Tax=Halothece sp. (strain PCC 7418) TaxID=65093 RepID=UPI000685313E|nr:hypothetical protein [Halothece sp. PCC 7418]
MVREDFKELSTFLVNQFWEHYKPLLKTDPYNCSGFPNHALKGKLRGYRALEIDWEGVAYRLVYRVYEKPSPRRVLVISFAEHDPAYEKAIARIKN